MKDHVPFIDFQPCVRTLPGGLGIALEPLPHLHTVTAGVWIKTGSANETEREAGISHFIEHLLFKGTNTRTAREIMHEIECRGGSMNAFTSREYTCYYVRIRDRHLPVALDLLSDIIKHPIYADLEKERNVILEEIASANDVPEELVHDLLTEHVWPKHPLGRPIAGYAETVSAVSLDDIRAYKEAWYRPGNMVAAISGNIDVDVAAKMIEDAFGDLAPGGEPLRNGAPKVRGAGIQMTQRDIAQMHVTLAFPSSSLADEDRYAHDMLSSTLGGGSTSRLFDRVREEAGLAYSIYSFRSGYLATGMLGVYAAIAPENLQLALDLCCQEMRDLRDNPIPEEERESNAEQIKGSLLLGLESTFNRMARMGRSLLVYGRVIPVEELTESVDAVTCDDIQRAAQSTFTAEACAAAILGPESKEPALRL